MGKRPPSAGQIEECEGQRGVDGGWVVGRGAVKGRLSADAKAVNAERAEAGSPFGKPSYATRGTLCFFPDLIRSPLERCNAPLIQSRHRP